MNNTAEYSSILVNTHRFEINTDGLSLKRRGTRRVIPEQFLLIRWRLAETVFLFFCPGLLKSPIHTSTLLRRPTAIFKPIAPPSPPFDIYTPYTHKAKQKTQTNTSSSCDPSSRMSTRSRSARRRRSGFDRSTQTAFP